MNSPDALGYPHLEPWNFTYKACTDVSSCQNGTFNPLKRCTVFPGVGSICACEYHVGRYGADCMTRSSFGDSVAAMHVIPAVYSSMTLLRSLRLLLFRLKQKNKANASASLCLVLTILSTSLCIVSLTLRTIVQFSTAPEVVYGTLQVVRNFMAPFQTLLGFLSVCMVSLMWLNIIAGLKMVRLDWGIRRAKAIVGFFALIVAAAMFVLVVKEDFVTASVVAVFSMLLAYITIPLCARKLSMLLLRTSTSRSSRNSDRNSSVHKNQSCEVTHSTDRELLRTTSRKIYEKALVSLMFAMKSISKRLLVGFVGMLIIGALMASPPLKSELFPPGFVASVAALSFTYLAAGIINYIQSCTIGFDKHTSNVLSQATKIAATSSKTSPPTTGLKQSKSPSVLSSAVQ